MESKNKNHGENEIKKHKKIIILPKSFIAQEPPAINHARSRSFGDISPDFFDNQIDNAIENNPYRFPTERKKRVSFNNKIQIINIHNYKNENKILYYGKEDEEKENNQKETKCISCFIF